MMNETCQYTITSTKTSMAQLRSVLLEGTRPIIIVQQIMLKYPNLAQQKVYTMAQNPKYSPIHCATTLTFQKKKNLLFVCGMHSAKRSNLHLSISQRRSTTVSFETIPILDMKLQVDSIMLTISERMSLHLTSF